ncbi:hypothetical protein C8R44DRAFT_876785 [Mycena epipterygia]|nr:hypothetical protein C8R44DRAFT_876785 [Mycena epipterygia]
MPFCVPPLFPEDLNTLVHDGNANSAYYVVLVGRVPGIYTESAEGSAQILGYSGANWKRVRIFNEAQDLWRTWCAQHHNHPEVVAEEVAEIKWRVVGVAGSFISREAALEAAGELVYAE